MPMLMITGGKPILEEFIIPQKQAAFPWGKTPKTPVCFAGANNYLGHGYLLT
jgi:hypothetical protein